MDCKGCKGCQWADVTMRADDGVTPAQVYCLPHGGGCPKRVEPKAVEMPGDGHGKGMG